MSLPEPHGFVPLETSPYSMSFWDAGDIRRDGDHIEIGVLRISVGRGTPIFVWGSLQRTRTSCEWETIDRFLGAVRYDSAGHALETPDELAARPAPFVQPTFYGPYGAYAGIIGAACDPDFQVPVTALPSVAAAMDLGRRILKPLPPSTTTNTIMVQRVALQPLQPLPGYLDLGPYRFGVIASEPSSGNMAFLDWAGLRRSGAQAAALILDVLGDDTPPAPRWTIATIALRSVRFDCAARTLTYLGYATFDKTMTVRSQDNLAWPARSVRHWRLGAALLDAACSGGEPAQTFATLDGAIAFQRQLHPLRTENTPLPAP
jgi:hypothetical protein